MDPVELPRRHRVPAVSLSRLRVDQGRSMAYGPSLPDPWRRAATCVDRILRGARPGDLPIEQPTRLELVVNLGTARAIGPTVPGSVLVRADVVLE